MADGSGRRFNAELAEHAEKFQEFASAGFAVSAFNVMICSLYIADG
jgi:hypothetical protein